MRSGTREKREERRERRQTRIDQNMYMYMHKSLPADPHFSHRRRESTQAHVCSLQIRVYCVGSFLSRFPLLLFLLFCPLVLGLCERIPTPLSSLLSPPSSLSGKLLPPLRLASASSQQEGHDNAPGNEDAPTYGT